MPQNIVVGKDAEEVAEFVAKYAGTKAKSPPSPIPNQDTAPPDAGVTGKSAPATAARSGRRPRSTSS